MSGHDRRPVWMMIGGRLESILPHQLQLCDADNFLVAPHFDQKEVAQAKIVGLQSADVNLNALWNV